jgi:two-component system LytT family response regulator
VRVLVVDDEPPARRHLIRMLSAMHGVEVVGDAEDGVAAMAAIAQTRPELLLLDIHMPGLDGLALTARYADLPPVVFVTAYDEHAIRAFELGAIDYLMKPVRPARLAQAIERAGARGSARAGFAALATALPADAAPRVVVSDRGTVRLFDARQITRFRAADKYTAFVVDGEEHLTEEPLAALEDRLGPYGFVRVHRGELVALRAIASFAGQQVRLCDGQVARVSRRLSGTLRRRLAR